MSAWLAEGVLSRLEDNVDQEGAHAMKGLSIGLATGGLMLMAATWGHAGEEVRKSDAPAAGPLRIHPQNPHTSPTAVAGWST